MIALILSLITSLRYQLTDKERAKDPRQPQSIKNCSNLSLESGRIVGKVEFHITEKNLYQLQNTKI